MKKFLLLLFTVGVALGFTACDSEDPVTPEDDNITPLKFEPKSSFVVRYDEYPVDTAGTLENKPILTEKRVVEEITVDTGMTYEGKSGVSLHIAPASRFDTSYFAQDANGDLYRYNYGFSMLNSFEELKNAVGGPINMKWVLVMKFGKKEGAKWVAKADSVYLPSFGAWIHMRDTATMLSDTTITVGTEQIDCRRARHKITAEGTVFNLKTVGTIETETYISAKYGKVVWDFVRRGTITGAVNARVRGVFKIMTFHE